MSLKQHLYKTPPLLHISHIGVQTHGLNEELGRHNTRNSSKACFFCECEYESVEHVLWECSEYSSICREFIKNLDVFLQNDFHLKSSFDKTTVL